MWQQLALALGLWPTIWNFQLLYDWIRQANVFLSQPVNSIRLGLMQTFESSFESSEVTVIDLRGS